MSKPAADPAALFARLAPATRDQLRAIGCEARDPVGDPRDYQIVFDRHVGFLDALTAAGLQHNKLASVLAAVGIRRGDGTPLPRGTVSSALCRARLRAAAAQAAIGAESAAAAKPLQPAAQSGSSLHAEASTGSPLQHPAADGSMPQQLAAHHPGPPPASRRRPPAGGKPAATTAQPHKRASATATPSDHAAAAANRRAAAIVNQLRSKQP